MWGGGGRDGAGEDKNPWWRRAVSGGIGTPRLDQSKRRGNDHSCHHLKHSKITEAWPSQQVASYPPVLAQWGGRQTSQPAGGGRHGGGGGRLRACVTFTEQLIHAGKHACTARVRAARTPEGKLCRILSS